MSTDYNYCRSLDSQEPDCAVSQLANNPLLPVVAGYLRFSSLESFVCVNSKLNLILGIVVCPVTLDRAAE